MKQCALCTDEAKWRYKLNDTQFMNVCEEHYRQMTLKSYILHTGHLRDNDLWIPIDENEKVLKLERKE